MQTNRRQFWVAGLVAVLLIAGTGVSASGQSILTGKLTGTITDDKGEPLPGVNLEITSPALISGKRATVSTARGTFVFLNLPVGVYAITASLTSFKSVVQEGVMISAGGSFVVDLVLPIGDINETVEVVGNASIVDAKTSTIDSKIESEMLNKLPTSRDAFYDLSLTTPGMFDHGSVGGSMPSPTAYGGASNENVFLVNGVNATNPRGATFGTLVRVNYNAVEEVRIVALGSKAEYGSFSGAAIDVLTKSGSNAIHGTAAFYIEPGKWVGKNQPAGTEKYGTTWIYVDPTVVLNGTQEKNWEGNFTIGGPIVKDRVWFYGGFDYLYNSGKIPRWDLMRENWGLYGDMKITAEPFTNHRAWVSYHFESDGETGGKWGSQPEWDTTMNYGIGSINHTVSAQWQWLPASTTILTAKYLGFWTNSTPNLPDDRPDHPGYINWWKWASYGINGAFPYIEGYRSLRQTIQADVSHYAEDFLGEHDIKFGVQFTKGRSNSLNGYFQNYANFLYPYRWTQNVSYMQSWYQDTGLLFYNHHDEINPFLTVGTADSLGIFLDDQWSPTKQLTVNVGLRYDRMTTKYGEGEVYQFLTKPSDIENPTVLRKRQGTDNIFDFKTFSPRLGLTYSLTEDGKTVARASFGRFYLPMMVEYLRRYGPDCPLVNRTDQFYYVPWDIADANGDGLIDAIETRNAAREIAGMTPAWEVVYEPTDYFSWKLNVADGLKDQYTDQITLNLEREIFTNFSVSASWIYKHSGNIFAHVPVNKATGEEWAYDRIPYTTAAGQTVQLYSIKWLDYNGDGTIDNADIHWIGDNSDYRVVNMGTYDGIKPKRDYMGFQLVFNKRYSDRWQLLGSILYSSSKGMANRIFGNDMNAEGPMFYDNTWMGSLNYTINNLEGPLPFVPKLEFKVSGSYTIPNIELDLGARFRMHTGRPIWTLEEIPVRSEWGGAEGSVIGGGLGTIVAGDPLNPDHLPIQTILDLRAEKTFNISRLGRMSIVLDIFNVFNADTPNSVDNQWEYGRVGGIVDPRSFRFSFLYQF